jgi:hypothetical protein
MEPRIARIESDVAHMKLDITNIQLDMREFRGDMKAANQAIAGVKDAVVTLDSRAERNVCLGEIRKDFAAMRKDIASIGKMQKATLCLLGVALALVAIGFPVAHGIR